MRIEHAAISKPAARALKGAASRRTVSAVGRLTLPIVPSLLVLILMAALAPQVAGAAEATYGELSRFGTAGTGPGQFTLTKRTHAFGVDPTDDSVYVGDEPKKHEYRVQKLTASGAFVAQTAMLKPPNDSGIEGIAVDPALKRLYVLALEKRTFTRGEVIAEAPVAGTLYAFSTEPEGEELVPASGTAAEGVLTDPETFLSQAKPASLALTEPRGIAVDPSTHDVIVMGEVEKGDPSTNSIALQRVSATGALEARYTTKELEKSGLASSPTVSSTGDVYVAQNDEVMQVPSDFASAEAPALFGEVSGSVSFEGEQVLLELPDQLTQKGGGLSFAPEGPQGEPEGALFAAAGVLDEKAYYPGIVAFDASSGAVSGWTGGQTRQVGEACTIGFSGTTYPMIAAGGEGTVFVLDSQFAQVIELGPGGGGCPAASDGELKALVGGAPLSGQIDEGTEVTLESNLVQADAASVEWSFGEGEEKPLKLAGGERQHTEVIHTFEEGGEHTVTEVIHTDDLATPIVEASAVVSVRVGRQPPTAVISGPIVVDVGASADFDGSASWDPNGHVGSTAIKRWEWSFGDGGTAVTEAPEVQHVYTTPGLYTASLVVEDSFGLKSEPSSIPVTAQVPPPPLVQETLPASIGEGGGAEEAAKATTPPPVSAHGSGASPPSAHLASAVLPVSAHGVVSAVVSCPATAGHCTGTLSLRTVGRVRVGRGRRAKARALTLASVSFSIAAGRARSLTLRLSHAARALLARSRTLAVQATITAGGNDGAAHVTDAVVELRKPVKRSRRKGR